MNKIWIFILVMVVSVAFVGCKKDTVVPDPEIVTFNVLPGTSFTLGDKITVNFEAKNAVSSENNIGAPTTTNWSYTFTANLNITNIKVSAINKTGIKIEKSVNIAVVIPYVTDRTDSLCSMVWSLKTNDILDKNGNIIFSTSLPDEMMTDKHYFYKDNFTEKVFDKNGNFVGGPYDWKWTGPNTIIMGSQTYLYTLKDNKFSRYQQSNDGTEISRDVFIGVKI